MGRLYSTEVLVNFLTDIRGFSRSHTWFRTSKRFYPWEWTDEWGRLGLSRDEKRLSLFFTVFDLDLDTVPYQSDRIDF